MNALIELRQRSRGYELVDTEDDYDTVPVHYSPRKDIHEMVNEIQEEQSQDEIYYPSSGSKKKKSKSCAWCLFLLSISGVVFLTSIGILLKSDSIYLKVGKENENSKPMLGDHVVGAAMMYLLTAVLSGYYIYRTPSSYSSSPCPSPRRISRNKDFS